MNKFIVSEDTEVVLNGKRMLLEKGDKIVINEMYEYNDDGSASAASSLEITKIEDLTEWAKHNNKKLALQTVYGCERHRSQSQRSGWSEIDPEKLWDLLEKENEDLNKEECYISEGGAEEEFGHPLHLISFSVGIYGEKEWGQLDSLYLEGAKESGKVAIS